MRSQLTPESIIRIFVRAKGHLAIQFQHCALRQRELAMLAVIAAAFLPAAASAQTRVINVPLATGNSTQDTANVKNALTAAQNAFNGATLSGRSGVAIVFPAGTYNINSRLTLDIQTIPKNDGGLMIRGAGGNSTVIASGDSTGALLLNVHTPNKSTAHIQISIEDMGFVASATCTDTPNTLNSGAAIQIMPYNSTVGDSALMPTEGATVPALVTYPTLRNVTISGPFKYGFKAYRVTRSMLEKVSVTGVTGATIAGLHFTSTYGGNWSECNISNATYGVYSKYAGEGGGIELSNINNVDYGMYMDLSGAAPLMSNSGSFVRNCTITAKTRGIFYYRKRFVYITKNTLAPSASAAGYKDIELKASGYCHIHSNVFSAGTRVAAISISDGDSSDGLNGKRMSISNMIHDNNFGTTGTWVDIGTGVIETMIFKNATTGSTGHVSNLGSATWISDGQPSPENAISAFSQKFFWSEIPAIGSVNLFDVTASSYGANGADTGDDTVAINKAITAMLDYLNHGTARKAFLYFPAGTYIVDGTLQKISQSGQTIAWGQVNIYGDGPDVSVIETKSSTGLFDIDTSLEHAGVKIHNLSMISAAANTGVAVKITGSLNGLTGAPSLFMHSVDIQGKENSYYFQTGVYGKTLQKPALKDISIDMCGLGMEADTIPGTRGVQLLDSDGGEIEGVAFKKRLERGLEIKCRTANPIQIRRGAAVTPDIGIWIDGGPLKAGVAIDEVHTNNVKTNIFIQNANGVDCANFESLNYDTGNADVAVAQGHSSVYLHGCQNVTMRDNTFFHSDVPYNIFRRIVQVDGGSSNLTISANHFQEPGGTYIWLHSNTNGPNSVVNNRFCRTDVDDVNAPIATNTTISRLYQLNGENGAYYLLRNTGSPNGYLDTSLNTAGQDISNSGLWKITATDAGGQNYTLVNKSNNSQLSAVVTKKATGYYTFVLNGTGLPNTISWQPILFDKLVEGWDHSSMDTNNIGGWNIVHFSRPFPYVPAVFVGGPSADTGDYAGPLTARVRNVSPTGFEFQLQDWNNATVTSNATVGFIALHRGSYDVYPSQSLEAGTIGGVGTSWRTCSFKKPFASGITPCVFAQCSTPLNQTDPDPSPACVRIRNVGSATFEIRIEANSESASHGVENVDYIAFEPSIPSPSEEARHGFQVGVVNGVSAGGSDVNFLLDNRDFSDVGFVGIAQSFNGSNPCALRYQNLDKKAKSVRMRLDVPVDPSTHPAETAAWMVFENLY